MGGGRHMTVTSKLKYTKESLIQTRQQGWDDLLHVWVTQQK